MIYILSGAYKALLFSLSLKNSGEDITIITYNQSIIKYCKVNEIKCIEYASRPIGLNIFKFIKYKKNLDNIITKINVNKDDCFLLLSDASTYDFFYLVKKFSKKTKVFFKNVDREKVLFKNPIWKLFIRGAILKLILKTILGLNNLIYYNVNNNPKIGINEKFLKENNIEEYKPTISAETFIFDAIKNTESSYKKFDNLFIDQGPLGEIIDFQSIEKILKKLFLLNCNIAFKKHPIQSKSKSEFAKKLYNIFKNCEEIPEYIPVELFCNNIRKNVISFYSTSLITASQFEHLNAISFLELVTWYNDSYKNEMKEHLIKKSENKILFPENFKELEQILMKK